MAAGPLRAATRGSQLALWQTRWVAERLAVPVEEVVVVTTGDRRRDVPIHDIGGRGVFVREVQTAVLEGRADFAVHSAKDLPPREAPGLLLACVPTRADPRDALVGTTLDALPPGAVVATGSVRRRAQLAWRRPDLTFTGLRGNVNTRLDRAAGHDAIVVAAAAVERLGRASELAEVLSTRVMLPQVGQGALAVECRADDEATIALLAAIQDQSSRAEVDAERAFLDSLGGGCDVPVGALGRLAPDTGVLSLEAMVASLDGRIVLRHRDEAEAAPDGGPAAVALGRSAAGALMAAGAGTVLAA